MDVRAVTEAGVPIIFEHQPFTLHSKRFNLKRSSCDGAGVFPPDYDRGFLKIMASLPICETHRKYRLTSNMFWIGLRWGVVQYANASTGCPCFHTRRLRLLVGRIASMRCRLLAPLSYLCLGMLFQTLLLEKDSRLTTRLHLR